MDDKASEQHCEARTEPRFAGVRYVMVTVRGGRTTGETRGVLPREVLKI